MKRIPILILGLACASALSAKTVLRLEVQAAIHPISAEYVRAGIDRAERDGADLVLLRLNTPGGLDSSMREIIERILASRVPVAAYVAPSGARAASAGFFIGIACDIFAMAPGTSTGAAHPVGVGIGGQAMDKTMEDKVTHDAASYIKTLAERRGRNVKMAEDGVRQSLSYTEREALAGGVIDLIATDEAELLAALDGRTIKLFDGEERTLDLREARVEDMPMSARQKFLITIANPNFAYILLMLGLLGLYFEFANPGAILPGVLGGICLLLAVFAFQILPINYVGLLLILLAAVCFVLEVKVHSYGLLSVGGIAAMIIGSLMLVNAPIPEMKPSLSLILPVALSVSAIVLFLVALVVRAHVRRAATGREGLEGEFGETRTDLAPEGKVFVHGEIWDAVADEPLPRGTRVKIVEVLDHLKVRVVRA
ncbi:MAG: nodulation protein NfeD [Candidatus Aminicenantes bacterium]|nr:nodulation protein NfeD [Candidatus Aminicenantes bacterium]